MDQGAAFVKSIQKNQRVPGSRGRIYDRNGTIRAENKLSYDLTLEDSQRYRTKKERQGTLNGIVYRLQKIVDHTDKVNVIIPMGVDRDGNYVFTESGFRQEHFKADLFGKTGTEDLTEKESQMTAPDIMAYMCGADMFMLGENNLLHYRPDELEMYGLPIYLSHEEINLR